MANTYTDDQLAALNDALVAITNYDQFIAVYNALPDDLRSALDAWEDTHHPIEA